MATLQKEPENIVEEVQPSGFDALPPVPPEFLQHAGIVMENVPEPNVQNTENDIDNSNEKEIEAIEEQSLVDDDDENEESVDTQMSQQAYATNDQDTNEDTIEVSNDSNDANSEAMNKKTQSNTENTSEDDRERPVTQAMEAQSSQVANDTLTEANAEIAVATVVSTTEVAPPDVQPITEDVVVVSEVDVAPETTGLNLDTPVERGAVFFSDSNISTDEQNRIIESLYVETNQTEEAAEDSDSTPIEAQDFQPALYPVLIASSVDNTDAVELTTSSELIDGQQLATDDVALDTLTVNTEGLELDAAEAMLETTPLTEPPEVDIEPEALIAISAIPLEEALDEEIALEQGTSVDAPPMPELANVQGDTNAHVFATSVATVPNADTMFQGARSIQTPTDSMCFESSRRLIDVVEIPDLMDIVRCIEAVEYENPEYEKLNSVPIGKNDSEESNKFFSLVGKLKASELKFGQIEELIQQTSSSNDVMVGNVFVTKRGVVVQSRPAHSNGRMVEAKVDFVHKIFAEEKLGHYREYLEEILEKYSTDAVDLSFERDLVVFEINHVIDNLVARLNADTGEGGTVHQLVLEKEVFSKLRAMLHILLDYEKDVAQDLAENRNGAKWKTRFVAKLRDWSVYLMSTLQSRGEFKERVVLVKEIVDYPAAGLLQEPWILQGLQMIPHPSNSFLVRDADQYIAAFRIFLESLVNQLAQNDIEDSDNHPIFRNGYAETELLEIFEQTQFETAAAGFYPQGTSDDISAIARLYLRGAQVLEALVQFAQHFALFPQLEKRLILACISVLSAGANYMKQMEALEDPQTRAAYVTAQISFDSQTLKVFRFIVNHADKNLVRLVRELPLHAMSSEATWKVFVSSLLRFSDDHFDDPKEIAESSCLSNASPIPRSTSSTNLDSLVLMDSNEGVDGVLDLYSLCKKAVTLRQWIELVEHRPQLRARAVKVFHIRSDNLSGSETAVGSESEALFQLSVLTSIAVAVEIELAHAVLLELLYIGFVAPRTNLLDSVVQPICESIADICAAHTKLTAVVIQEIDLNKDCFVKEGALLLARLPVDKWRVDRGSADLDILHGWLKMNGCPLTTFAMEIIDRMSLEVDKENNLPLLPALHRYLAYILADVHGIRSRPLRKPRSESWKKWIPLTQEYNSSKESEAVMSWCWRTVHRLKFYHNFSLLEPYIDIGDSSSSGLDGQLRILWEDIALSLSHSNADLTSANPLISYLVLMLTNYPMIRDWKPWQILLHHSHASPSAVYDRAVFNVIFNVLANYSMHRDTWPTFPAATTWLLSFAPSLKELSKGVVNDFLERGVFTNSIDDISSIIASRRGLFDTYVAIIKGQIYQCATLEKENLAEGLLQGAVRFWFDNVCSLKDWNTNPYTLHILNSVIMVAESMCYQSISGFIRMYFGKLATALVDKQEIEGKCDSATVFSLIPAPIKTGFFAKTDVNVVVKDCDWLSFHALMIETAFEYPLWVAVGHLIPEGKPKALDKFKSTMEPMLRRAGINTKGNAAFKYMHTNCKDLSQFRIYRWANYALEVPAEHPLLVAYWQMFFHLYFSRSGSVVFGYKFLGDTKKHGWRSNLREQLHMRAKEIAHSLERDAGHNAMIKCELFKAFSLWLREPDPSKLLGDGANGLSSLGPEYAVGRLTALTDSPILQVLNKNILTDDSMAIRRYLWFDMIDFSEMVEHFQIKPTEAENTRARTTKRNRRHSEPLPKFVHAAPPLFQFRAPEIPKMPDPVTVNAVDTLSALLEPTTVHADTKKNVHSLINEMMQIIPGLYERTQRVERVEVTDDTKSSNVYVFEVPVEEYTLVQTVDAQLKDHWKQYLDNCTSFLYGELGEEDDATTLSNVALCKAVFIARYVVAELEYLINFGENEREVAIYRQGIQWFRDFCNMENVKSRDYPPLQRILWSGITGLGSAFAKGTISETPGMLEFMLHDSERVALVAPIFAPVVEQVFELYCRLFDQIDLLEPDRISTILSGFRFDDWIALRPDFATRERFVQMLGGVIRKFCWRHFGTNAPNVYAEVIAFHLKLFCSQCESHLQDHFITAIRILIGAQTQSESGNLPVQNDILDKFLEISPEAWDTVTFSQACEACVIVGEQMMHARINGCTDASQLEIPCGSLLSQFDLLGNAPSLLKLQKQLADLVYERIGRANAEEHDAMIVRAWNAIKTMYKPWIISAVSMPDSSKLVEAPWTNSALRDGTADSILSEPLRHLSAMCSAYNDQIIFGLAWEFYLGDLTSGADIGTVELCSEKFLTLSWNLWIIPPSELVLSRDSLASIPAGDPTFDFLIKIFTKLDWETICAQEIDFNYRDCLFEVISMIFCLHPLPIPAPVMILVKHLKEIGVVSSCTATTYTDMLKSVTERVNPQSKINLRAMPAEGAVSSYEHRITELFGWFLACAGPDFEDNSTEKFSEFVKFFVAGLVSIAGQSEAVNQTVGSGGYFWATIQSQVCGFIFHQLCHDLGHKYRLLGHNPGFRADNAAKIVDHILFMFRIRGVYVFPLALLESVADLQSDLNIEFNPKTLENFPVPFTKLWSKKIFPFATAGHVYYNAFTDGGSPKVLANHSSSSGKKSAKMTKKASSTASSKDMKRHASSAAQQGPPNKKGFMAGMGCSALFSNFMSEFPELIPVFLERGFNVLGEAAQIVDFSENLFRLWFEQEYNMHEVYEPFKSAVFKKSLSTLEYSRICQTRGAWLVLFMLYAVKASDPAPKDNIFMVELFDSVRVAVSRELTMGTYLRPSSEHILPVLALGIKRILSSEAQDALKVDQLVVITEILEQFVIEPSRSLAHFGSSLYGKLVDLAGGSSEKTLPDIYHKSGHRVTPHFRLFVLCFIQFLYANMYPKRHTLRTTDTSPAHITSKKYQAKINDLKKVQVAYPGVSEAIDKGKSWNMLRWREYVSILESRWLQHSSAFSLYELDASPRPLAEMRFTSDML